MKLVNCGTGTTYEVVGPAATVDCDDVDVVDDGVIRGNIDPLKLNLELIIFVTPLIEIIDERPLLVAEAVDGSDAIEFAFVFVAVNEPKNDDLLDDKLSPNEF